MVLCAAAPFRFFSFRSLSGEVSTPLASIFFLDSAFSIAQAQARPGLIQVGQVARLHLPRLPGVLKIASFVDAQRGTLFF